MLNDYKIKLMKLLIISMIKLTNLRNILRMLMKILKNIPDIAVNEFTEKDVVRHRLVQDIIKAYEKSEEGRKR